MDSSANTLHVIDKKGAPEKKEHLIQVLLLIKESSKLVYQYDRDISLVTRLQENTFYLMNRGNLITDH